MAPKPVAWKEINDVRLHQKTKLYEKLLGTQGEDIFPQDYTMYGIDAPMDGFDVEKTREMLKYKKIDKDSINQEELAKTRRKLSRLMPLREAIHILQLTEASEDAIQEVGKLLNKLYM